MASAQEQGVFEVKFSDTAEADPKTIYSAHTAIISGAAKAAPTGATYDAIPFTASGSVKAAFAKGRVLVYFISDAADIIESEESQWEIPVVLYEELPGAKVGRPLKNFVLTQENMTGFTQAGTVDVTVAAGVPARIAYYDVARGQLLALDPRGKVRAYIGDDS